MEKKDDNTIQPNNDKKIEESNIKKPKKRGRKPKNLLNPNAPKKSIKKEKKRKEKIGNHDFGMVEKDTSGISTEHLILHLKINTQDSKFKPNHQTEQDLLAYTPELNEPLPYEMLPSDSYPCPLVNPLEDDPSDNTESPKVLNSTKEDKKMKNSIHSTKKNENNEEKENLDLEYTEDGKRKWISENTCSQVINKNNYQNLSSFQQKSERVNKSATDVPVHHLPPITDINCWWCCHSFTWNPFVLPISKENNKVYRSIGCFCCPECCAAYIFESGKRATIKPIHSLASYLMDGVGKPDLIVDGYASPHGFALKPSHAKMLQDADIIFWVGEDIENFLEKPLKSIAKNAEKIELMEIKKLTKLKFRERNIFDEHDDHGHDDHAKKDDHDDHDHDKKGHKEDDHDDHDHDKKGHKEEGHDDHGHGHEGHAHGEFDPHIWLDPMNAKIILDEMAIHLIENDQKNEKKYKENLKSAHKDLDKLTKKIKSDLNKDFKSVVFHDAYQYFEKRFGINILGAFTVNTDVMPGAEQLAEIREVIEHDKVSCIFSEPQFNPDIIKAVAKDMNIATGVIDPLGATLDPGKDLYFDLINNMSKSFKGC